MLRLAAAVSAGGVTWGAVGVAIGTTGQGALNRFGALVRGDEAASEPGDIVDDADEAGTTNERHGPSDPGPQVQRGGPVKVATCSDRIRVAPL
jgi:hypothetical protein